MSLLSILNTKKFHLLCTIACLAIACTPSQPEVQLTISKCSPMPVYRAASTCFVIGDEAYIFAGRDSVGTYCNDLWKYDSQSDTWSNLGSTPLKGRVNATACVHDGYAYVGLGFNGTYNNVDSYLTDWWKYDVLKNHWERLQDYPAHTTARAISMVGEGELYVGYGFNWTYERDMYRYTIDSDQWEYINVHLDRKAFTFPTRSFGGVGTTCQGRHFAGTGFRANSLNWWGEFDPTGEWIRRTNVPGHKRTLGACAATEEFVYVIGGTHFGGVNTDGKILSDIQQYNPQNDTWTHVGNLPDGGLFNHIAFSIGDRVYVGLGEDENFNMNNRLYCIHEK